jgi:hypothetical protein
VRLTLQDIKDAETPNVSMPNIDVAVVGTLRGTLVGSLADGHGNGIAVGGTVLDQLYAFSFLVRTLRDMHGAAAVSEAFRIAMAADGGEIIIGGPRKG